MWPFSRLERSLRSLAWRQVRVCGFSARLIRGTEMLFYAVTAAPPVDKDVVSRILTVTVNGEARPPVSFTADATSLGEVAVTEGDEVVLVLVDLDDAGNSSSPAELAFTAADTLPPATPEFGVTLVREE
jgi:hypothetical protein